MGLSAYGGSLPRVGERVRHAGRGELRPALVPPLREGLGRSRGAMGAPLRGHLSVGGLRLLAAERGAEARLRRGRAARLEMGSGV